MIKKLIFPVLWALLSASVSAARTAPATNPSPDLQAALDHNTALVKTPSDEDIQYAPQAAEALLEASAFAQALERIINTLPSNLSAKDQAIVFLQETNFQVASIELFMKKKAKAHTSSSSVTRQELEDHVKTETAGTLARTDLLVELLTTMLPSATSNDAEEMSYKALQFIADLSTTTSEITVALAKNNKGTMHHEMKHHQSHHQDNQNNDFNPTELQALLSSDLQMFNTDTSSLS